jgi:co-chaperonin GroES (HSP10)
MADYGPTDPDRWKPEDTHHGGDPDRLRAMQPLRGRALVQAEPEPRKGLIHLIKPEGRKAMGPQFGTVLRLGPPARSKDGVEIPWGCKAGDRVLFVYAVALERVRHFEEDLVVVAQEEVQAVIERGEEVQA